jgi:release factor glutamine methyltransferase
LAATAVRLLRLVRFHVFDRRRHGRLVLERSLGFPLIVLPEVLNPALFLSSGFAAEALGTGLVPEDAEVLDLGTGSGVLAVAAAATAGRVVAVDVNPQAVRCARLNALLNGREERIEVRLGDLYGPVAGERFDLVVSNPPYYPGEPTSPLERALRSPGFAEGFAGGLSEHLKAGGSALVVLSSVGTEAEFVRAVEDAGLRASVTAERDLVSERLRLYRVSPAGE